MSLARVDGEVVGIERPIMPLGTDDRHVVSVAQFVPHLLPELFERADELRTMDEDPDGRRDLAQRYIGGRIVTLFYEPSTRTRVSFETAAVGLGMAYVSTENATTFSSAAKGETIEDTVRVLGEYGHDAVVIRHSEKGSLHRAALASPIPVINAGDGAGEHPTQSLLDAYTIQREHGRLEGLTIAMGGDLKYGRTVRSLAQLMSRYQDNHFVFISPPELQMEEDVKDVLSENGAHFEETDDVVDALADADVVYWTRTQKERHALAQPNKLKKAIQAGKSAINSVVAGAKSEPEPDPFILDRETIRRLRDHATILHPLPRVGEISTNIDHDPRSKYFEQAGNGLYLRMVLLDDIMRGEQR